MGQPTPPKTKAISFSNDKNAKRKMIFAGAFAFAALFAITFVSSRKKKEDPAKIVAAKGDSVAEQENERLSSPGAPKPIAFQEGQTSNPAVMNPQQQDDPFLKQMEDFRKRQEAQRQRDDADKKRREQQEAIRAAQEGGATGQPGSLPPGMNPDGTAGASTAAGGQSPSAGGRGQGASTPLPKEKLDAPPLAGYDGTTWMVQDGGRVRPGYQSGSYFPSSQKGQEAMEQRWEQSFGAEMVVGGRPADQQRMQRLRQDLQGVPGGRFGARRGLGIMGNVPSGRTEYPRNQTVGWGNWIVVRPAESGEVKK